MVTALLGVASLTSESNLLFLMFCVCVSGVVLGLGFTWRAARSLSVRRLLPDRVEVGRPFRVRYELRRGRRLGRDFALELREQARGDGLHVAVGFIPMIRGRQTVCLDVPAIALRRGRLNLGEIRLSTGFPFGLFRKVVRAAAHGSIVAYPAMGHLRQDVLAATGSQDTGWAHAALCRRSPDELYGLREYRHGDNPQWIHWRRSARTGDLVVREMGAPRGGELLVVVDHRHDANQRPLVENLVSCAATLVCRAIDRDLRVGLLGLAAEVAAVAPAAGRRQRDRLLLDLATLTGRPSGTLADAMSRWPWPLSRDASAIFLTCVDDAGSGAVLRRLRQRVGRVRAMVAGSEEFAAAFQPPDPAAWPAPAERQA